MSYNTEEIRHAYKSKYNLNCENQIIILIITDGEKRYYRAVKSLPALLRVITSKHEDNFYFLNYFHSYSTKHKLKKHYNVCRHHDFRYVEISKKDKKLLKYNHGDKSMKVPFSIYADLEYLV